MCPDDIDAIYKIYEGNNLKYMENLYEDRNKEYEYIKDYQKYIYNFYDFGIWLFEDKKTGEIIGRGGVEYKIDDAENRNAELGYIIKKDRQRQGYAFEACVGNGLSGGRAYSGCPYQKIKRKNRGQSQ